VAFELRRESAYKDSRALRDEYGLTIIGGQTGLKRQGFPHRRDGLCRREGYLRVLGALELVLINWATRSGAGRGRGSGDGPTLTGGAPVGVR